MSDYHIRGEQSGETGSFREVTAKPATPSAGKWKWHFRSDGFYIIDDAGNEAKLGSLAESLVFASRIAAPAGFARGDLAGAFPFPLVVWDRDQNVLVNQIFGA